MDKSLICILLFCIFLNEKNAAKEEERNRKAAEEKVKKAAKEHADKKAAEKRKLNKKLKQVSHLIVNILYFL